MSTLQRQYDFCEAGHYTTNADPGDEARPPADAALPSRLLGPTGDVEAAVQRGMATVRRLLDDPDYARLAQKREAAEARVEELEAERARLREALEPLAALADAAEAWLGPNAMDDQPLDLQVLCDWLWEGRVECLRLAHARAARAALAGPNNPAGGPNTEQPGPNIAALAGEEGR